MGLAPRFHNRGSRVQVSMFGLMASGAENLQIFEATCKFLNDVGNHYAPMVGIKASPSNRRVTEFVDEISFTVFGEEMSVNNQRY